MNEIQVIKRDSIPAITSVEEGGVLHQLGELRDFSWHEPLNSFMGSGAGFSASWVQLAEQEVLKPHTHPVLSMMVFYAGAGRMLGDLARPLHGDEVVVVPAGCLHGFVAGPPGLYALSIQFAGGLYSAPEQPRVVFSDDAASLAGLLAHSELRAAAFARKPLFDMVRNTLPTNAGMRRAFLAGLRIWLEGSEALSVSRYATCNDPAYRAAFREHLVSFVGKGAERDAHSGVATTALPPPRDAALEALTGWFAYQMYVLDNAEKTAIVSLVVERVNSMLDKCLLHLLGNRQLRETFGLRERDTGAHVEREIGLLGHATPNTYTRLKDLVSEAWDMAEAMTDRVTAVTLRNGAA